MNLQRQDTNYYLNNLRNPFKINHTKKSGKVQNNKIKYNELKRGWNLLPVLTWKVVLRNKQGNKFYSLVSLVRNIQETVLSAQDTLYRKTDSVKYYITLQAIWQQIWGGSLIDIYKILNP